MNRKDFNLFTISILPFTQNVVGWGSECNTICFWNKGRQDVTINGVMVLAPGESFTFGGYPGEMLVQEFDIIFTNDREADCKLIVISKQYTQTLKR